MRKNLAMIASFIGLVAVSACGSTRGVTITTFFDSPSAAIGDNKSKFDALVKSGHYDWVDPNITYQNFPVKFSDTPTSIFQLVHLGEWISFEEALDRLDKIDFRPARIEELLAFGAKYPDEQRKYPIVVLGSSCVVGGSRHVLVLYGDSTFRHLLLGWFGDGWDAHYRFLVVRKSR